MKEIIKKDSYFLMKHWRFSKRRKLIKGKLVSYTSIFGWRAYPNGFPNIGKKYPLQYVGIGRTKLEAFHNMKPL